MSIHSIDLNDKVKLYNLAQAMGYAAMVLKSKGIVNIQVEQMSDNGEIYYKNLTPDEMDNLALQVSELFELGELEDEFLYD